MITSPEKESIYIKNLKKKVFLNFITLDIEEYLRDAYPARTFEEKIAEGDVSPVLDIFWKLLDNDSKRIVAAVKIFKWDGLKEIEMDFSDPVEKLKYVISGADEAAAILKAIFGTKSKSLPDTSENEKKSLKEEK